MRIFYSSSIILCLFGFLLTAISSMVSIVVITSVINHYYHHNHTNRRRHHHQDYIRHRHWHYLSPPNHFCFSCMLSWQSKSMIYLVSGEYQYLLRRTPMGTSIKLLWLIIFLKKNFFIYFFRWLELLRQIPHKIHASQLGFLDMW